MIETKVAPDGGYGWVIVFANGLANIMIIPLLQCFGLIFKDSFVSLGISATEGSLIININSAFTMLTGIINGVLLKVYGYRKIALLGAFLSTFGVILTSFSRTFLQFLITYGLITSTGMGMCQSSFSLAINVYFRKNRNRAVGYAMTLTGLGPILIPQIIRFLMKFHTTQGVTLILSGLVAHTFLSAILLQPVKWHMRTEIKEDEDDKNQTEDEIDEDEVQDEAETTAMYGVESAMSGSVLSLHSVTGRRQSVVSRKRSTTTFLPLKIEQNNNNHVYNSDLSQPKKEQTFLQRLWTNFSNYFDLDLFKDPIYINIMIGMSLAIFAEINFSVLTAFILADIGLNTDEIATFLSVVGFADIVFRFLAPFIGEYLNQPPRIMYGLTLLFLITTRFSLFITDNFYVLLVVGFCLGIAKGVRTVYMTLVIPAYVPLEKLASASGIQMMVNGLCILIGGPLIGVVRDLSGSYKFCVFIMNAVTFTAIIMWTTEYIVVKLKNNKKNIEESNELNEQKDILL